jgi:hypothetical protein
MFARVERVKRRFIGVKLVLIKLRRYDEMLWYW